MATTETTSTTSTTPASTILSTVEKDVKADAITALSWFQKHERIVITALVLTAGSWFGDHWLNVTAARDKQQAAIQVQQLDAQKTKDTALAQQVTTLASPR
jgi:predicted negative regulator of RcsB-dependent stress response